MSNPVIIFICVNWHQILLWCSGVNKKLKCFPQLAAIFIFPTLWHFVYDKSSSNKIHFLYGSAVFLSFNWQITFHNWMFNYWQFKLLTQKLVNPRQFSVFILSLSFCHSEVSVGLALHIIFSTHFNLYDSSVFTYLLL